MFVCMYQYLYVRTTSRFFFSAFFKIFILTPGFFTSS